MIIVEVFRTIRDAAPGEPTLVARVIGDRTGVRVEGPEVDVIDIDQPLVSLRGGAMITAEQDPENWVRSVAMSFRTPYLSARIVEDTPLPKAEFERADVRERVFR